ncbi:roadblock/LC7 domain-containing protein [Natronosporangium hydrolyticum]|uniref:Roadblock/LC7 domain-containing protein n=1 Tax=Natronosporangium hydrolyticum TaxID=2811111 RepID=A0A895YH55_9ACTN|nr:roadblock/LC7 domain-containing protein [Natronosporangium hydrolyticum]
MTDRYSDSYSGYASSADTLNGLLDNFVDRVPEVECAAAVSADGLVLAASRNLPRDSCDQLAAIASGLVSLLTGAARFFRAGHVVSNVTELDGGFMFSMSVSSGASLLALASRSCDLGLVGQELADLINRVEPTLTVCSRSDFLNNAGSVS